MQKGHGGTIISVAKSSGDTSNAKSSRQNKKAEQKLAEQKDGGNTSSAERSLQNKKVEQKLAEQR